MTSSRPTDQTREYVVTEHLLTPVGLRTLSPTDIAYRPSYQGDARERDRAYHQGVVWPWLLGPYVRAYLNVFGRAPEPVAHCRALVRRFEQHLQDTCLGTISEIFEGEPPFRAMGAPAQAWSVAELLAVSVFDLASTGRVATPGSAESRSPCR
jgi:glycogen debranching enzyme